MKKPDLKNLEQRCRDFNARVKLLETVVVYHPVIGEREGQTTRTRSEAYVLSGHTAVVFVEGVSGCIALDAIEILTGKDDDADETPLCPALVESVTNARTVRQVRRLMAEHTLNCPECLMSLGYSESEEKITMKSGPQLVKRGEGHEQLLLPTADDLPPSNAKSLPIPYNVAFQEVLGFVTEILKEAGEQWGDQAKQDAVCTILIAASKQRFLGLWERKAA